mmetsp:Transcript_13229/g.19930  ORF Transcript_13229/g.19930 Transcript_13229/m.19930 type:complete len:366 (+) Transcript_13229:61-1158(+)
MADIPTDYQPLARSAPAFHLSIPSKWESRKLRSSSSHDGFGSRNVRFDDHVSDIPGPGFYFEDKNNIVKKSASLSKKGFGNAFVSKSNRLRPVVLNDHVTGPGYYQPKEINEIYQPGKPGQFNTSGIDKGRVPFPDPSSYGPRPGPGEYKADANFLPGYLRKKPTSTFSSKSGRESFLTSTVNANTPSPLTYNPNITSTLPEKKVMWSKSQYKRFQDLGVDNKVPGPGRYFDTRSDEEKRREYESKNKRTCGRKVTKLLGKQNEKPKFTVHTFGADVNRFKHSFLGRLDLAAESPGPGWYTELDIHNPKAEAAQRPKASGVFKMTGAQTADLKKPIEHRPPGPAYYSPEKPKSKHFLHNPDQKWL